MSWRDRATTVQTTKGSWRDRATPVEIAPDKASMGESFARGAAQGATLGFEDELAGAGGVLGDAAGRVGVDKVEATNPELQAKLDAIADKNTPSMTDVYRRGRDEERKLNQDAENANGGSYFAGNLVSGLANPVSRIAGTLPGALGFGAAQGLGGSNSDLTQGQLDKAAIDTGIGTAAGGAGFGIGKAIPKLWDGVKYFGKKALTNLGPSSEAIEARLAGKAQDTAKNYPELAEDLVKNYNKLSNDTHQLDEQAWSTLSRSDKIEEGAIPKAYLNNIIDEADKKLKVDGIYGSEADEAAAKSLDDARKRIDQFGDNIPQSSVKRLIQRMRKDINYGDQTKSVNNEALKGITGGIDSELKRLNPSYEKAMGPVAERTAALENMAEKFGLTNVTNKGIRPSDSTAGKIKSSIDENKLVTQDASNKFAELTGTPSIQGQANDYRLGQQFQVKGPNASSKKSNLGIAIGTGMGGLAGGFMGAGAGAGLGGLAGGAMDAYGGRVAGKLIDSYLKAGNSTAFGKFKPVIEKAAQRGPEALAIISSILASNPEFKKQMQIE